MKRDIFQNWDTGDVFEVDVVEHDVTVDLLQVGRMLGIDEIRLLIQDAEDSLCTSQGLLNLVVEFAQLAKRLGEPARVSDKGGDEADRNHSSDCQPTAQSGDHSDVCIGQNSHHRHNEQGVRHRVGSNFSDPGVGFVKPRKNTILLTERHDHALSAERLLERSVKHTKVSLIVAESTAGPLPDDGHQPNHQREEEQTGDPESIILGFTQIGDESAWRNCNTRSIKEAAAERKIQLVFTNAEQKQENQIKALRSFIAYQVDVIAFVPIVTDGWDTVLHEAKDAGIPVLVTDRNINTSDESLYAGFIGTDSIREGRDAALFLLEKCAEKRKKFSETGETINIVELFGTEGSSVAIGRGEGFRQVIEEHPEFKIVFSESGDFLRSKGYELMNAILDEVQDMDVIYSHNDGMTLGAIDAMTEHGIRPGHDVVIVTIDAEQAVMDALKRGQVNFVIECNPKTGEAIMDLVTKLAAGEPIPRLLHVPEEVFTEGDDLSDLPPRGY